MKKQALCLLAVLFVLAATPAFAQNNNPAVVVATCGTPPANFPAAGSRSYLTVSSTGQICIAGSISLSGADGAIQDGVNDAIMATVFDYTNSNPLAVSIRDANGDIIASFGGGTQYTQGDSDATITGTAMLMEVAADTLQPVQGTVADGLLVNLGANNDVTVTGSVTVTATNLDVQIGGSDIVAVSQSGTWTVQPGNTANTTPWLISLNEGGVTADILDLTTTNPLTVAIVDGTGAQITSFGGGTQYAVDAALGSTPTGTVSICKRDDALSALTPIEGDAVECRVDANGGLWVTSTATADAAEDAAVATTPVPMGGVYRVTPVGLDDGDVGYLRLDANNILMVGDGVGALNVIVDSGSITADTELLAVAALADNTANPTITGIAAYNMCFDGSTWDRCAAATTGSGNVDTGTQRFTLAADGTGRLRIWDGTDVVDILDLTNSNPFSVAIVDGNGDQITSFGGGVQYTEGDTDATITGTAFLFESNTGTNTLSAVSAAAPLPVTCPDCSGTGVSHVDDAAFTNGTDDGAPFFAQYDTTPDAIDDGDAGIVRMNSSRVLMVDGSSVTQPVDALIPDTIGTIVTIDVDEETASVFTEGLQGVEVAIGGGAATLDATIVAEVTLNGGTWIPAVFVNPSTGAVSTSLVFTNPNTAVTRMIGFIGPIVAARIRVDSYTSGATEAFLTATQINPTMVAFGTDGTNIRAVKTDSGGELQVDVLTLPSVTGTVTANAGTNLNTSALALETSVDGIEALLTTIDGDTGNLVTVFGTASLILATQADDVANTADGLQTTSFSYVFDGTTWDRARAASAGAGASDDSTMRVGIANDDDVSDAATLFEANLVAHDAADAGNPLKIGARAVSFGATPTAVAAADRTDWLSTRAGVPFVAPGHPNIVTLEAQIEDADGAQTNAAIVTVSAGTKVVVTGVAVHCDGSTTGPTNVVVGFATATLPARAAGGTAGIIAAFDGVPAGGGMVKGFNGGILGVGADDEDVRITTEDPAGGSCSVELAYYTIAG